MKRAIAASIICLLSLSVLGLHAWLTWGSVDNLPPAFSLKEREFFEYSLFLESFAFLVTAAYFAGPKIYRLFGDLDAALKFSGEKENVSKIVNGYSALAVILRRLTLDPQAGVPSLTTALAIFAICSPMIVRLLTRQKPSAAKA